MFLNEFTNGLVGGLAILFTGLILMKGLDYFFNSIGKHQTPPTTLHQSKIKTRLQK